MKVLIFVVSITSVWATIPDTPSNNDDRTTSALSSFIDGQIYSPQWYLFPFALGIYTRPCSDVEALAQNSDEFNKEFNMSQACGFLRIFCQEIVADSQWVPDPQRDCRVKAAARATAQICSCGAVATWSSWAPWQMTVPCGTASVYTVRRRRVCESTSSGIAVCEGNSEQTSIRTCYKRPSLGTWSSWSDFAQTSPCNVSCMETVERWRICRADSKSPASSPASFCPGHSKDVVTRRCNTQECTVVNGGWSKWSTRAVSDCSATCGIGNQLVERYRKCNSPTPANNGSQCEGPSTNGTTTRYCELQICEQPACLSGKVVSGSPVSPPCKYPFIVGITYNGRKGCGGILISSNKVVTAAHCIRPQLSTVEVGKHCASNHDEAFNPNMQVIGVRDVNVHEDYEPGPPYFYDVAVILLEEDVHMGPCRQVVKMANTTTPTRTGRICTVAGWGLRSDGGSNADELIEADLLVYNYTDCNATFPVMSSVVDKQTICAANGTSGGVDACSNDSGGPLFCEDDGELVAYGIVSSGFGCAKPETAGLYMEVASFYEWIVSQFKDTPDSSI